MDAAGERRILFRNLRAADALTLGPLPDPGLAASQEWEETLWLPYPMQAL